MTLKERLRQALRSQSELEADEEKLEAAMRGTEPVAGCKGRCVVTVSGVLRSVTYSAAGSRPELLAELYDGSGSVDLVWMGRREIPGIEPGRRLVATGRMSDPDRRRGNRVVFNPQYRLLGRAGGDA